MHMERRSKWQGWITRIFLAVLVASTVSLIGQTKADAATSVNLSWGASSGATGYKLYYQADSSTQPFKGTGAAQGAAPITMGNVTSTTLSGLDPAHNYYAAVTAFNASGESGYSNVVTILESVAPTVSLTAPANGSTASGTMSVTASATDNIGVTKVEFYVNGTLAATDTASPYVYSWNTANLAAGTYTLMAKAYDAAGNVGTSSTISTSVVKDTTAPSVSLTSPASGATLSGTAAVSATASDNIGVTKVEFYAGSTLLGATNISPYSYSWNTSTMANGSYSITAKAYDAAGNVTTSSAAAVQLSNSTVTPPPPTAAGSIWSATTVPGLVDAGADSSVELGVKFRSDVSGYINGIRFYKASTNTGTHVGTLWSATGTKLASATFSNETASGWQQVNFATPVAVTANTVYVASYHSSTGHYSDDKSFFTGKGVDNATLHALADGVSGYNGVYAYGSSTLFPNLGYSGSNYWVDVAFSSTGTGSGGGSTTPTLSSISLTPASQTLAKGGTQQLTLTGTYTDGSTQSLTGATWTSSNTAVATVTSSGLATAVSAGTSTISATLSGVTGSTALTVPAPATVLAITTSTLAGGTQNSVYSAALAATGGTTPYLWSIASGALPAGVTLNGSTGYISGTPTANGSFSFTVQATDASSTKQSATKALTLTIAAAPTTTNTSVWSASTVPSTVDSGPDSAVELGMKFRSDVSGYITGIRFYKASTNTGTHVANLWTATGTKLASATFSAESASGWQQVNFATPVAITANTVYVASYHTNGGHYSDDMNFFSGKGADNAPLHALADGTSGFNGLYAYGSSSTFPNQGYNASNYWVDVVFHP